MICRVFPSCVTNALRSSAPCFYAKPCYNVTTDSIISCGEKKKTYQINNQGHWRCAKYHIDNRLIFSESEKKCDNLIVIKDDKGICHYIFVELKGIDVGTALEQLKNTIVESGLRRTKHVSARLVARSVPDLSMSRPSSKAILKWFVDNGVDYKHFNRFESEKASSLM